MTTKFFAGLALALSLLAPAHYLATPGLWAGIVVSAGLLAGAIWLRRSREAI